MCEATPALTSEPVFIRISTHSLYLKICRRQETNVHTDDVAAFINSLIHSFIHSFIRSFIYSFIHSLIHSFIHANS